MLSAQLMPTFRVQCPRWNIYGLPRPHVWTALVTWVCDKTSVGMQINGFVLRIQAERLQEKANKQLAPEEQLSFKFPKGWMDRFQKQHKVRCDAFTARPWIRNRNVCIRKFHKSDKRSPSIVRKMFGMQMSVDYFLKTFWLDFMDWACWRTQER